MNYTPNYGSSYFGPGPADAGASSGIAFSNKKRRKKRTGASGGTGSGGAGYGHIGGYPGLPRNRAANIINGQVQQLIRDLRLEAQKTRRESQQAANKARNLYERSRGDLGYVRGEVLDAMGGNNARIQDIYNQGKTETAGMTQDLVQGQNANTQAATGAAGAELARLGLTGSNNLGQIATDGAFATNMAQQAGANNQANLGLAQSMAGDVGNLLGSMAQGSYQSHMGKALNTRNDAITGIRDDTRDTLADIFGEMRNVRKGRGAMINELMEQMLGGDFDRWMAMQQLGMDRRQLNAALSGGGGGGSSSGGSGLWGNLNVGTPGKKKRPKKKKVPTVGGIPSGPSGINYGPKYS